MCYIYHLSPSSPSSTEPQSVHQRSKSADNLVIRPLSKEHEAVLRRYVDQAKVTEAQSTDYDSDHHTVRSLHEVTTHRVDMRALPDPEGPLGDLMRALPTPELPPGDRQGHYSLRRKMQLEGLVTSLPGEGPEGRRFEGYPGLPMHDIRHIDSPDVPIPFRKHDSSDYDEIGELCWVCQPALFLFLSPFYHSTS